jgi:hypothetical protein
VIGPEAYDSVERPVNRLIASSLEEAMTSGVVIRRDAVLLARLIVGALHEASLAIARSDEPDRVRDDAGAVIESWLMGLKTH